jgi:tRNA pseudouridine55 synthase
MISWSAEEVLNGQVLLLDKPLGWTSFQAVNAVKWSLRKALGLKKFKIGHAGTLDPLASGLLVICTGKMTKQIDTFQGQTKTYTGVMKLGATTPSYDLETPIEEIIPQFTGTIWQKPPVFSALKKEGQRLYELARQGTEVEIPARQIHIYELELGPWTDPELPFSVQCSKGTYIRSLAFDIGAALNSGAHLTELRRTQIGDFSVQAAWKIEDMKKSLGLADEPEKKQ